MRPARDQIEVAAYHRWQRRGGGHGGDHDDWVAAEKDLTFSMSYRWLVRHTLRGDGGGPVLLGRSEAKGRRRCRFCERAEPSATFETSPLAVPAMLGNDALIAWDECDDCRAQYVEHLASPFEAFARPLVAAEPERPRPGDGIPVPALKALVRMALAVMPSDELHHFDDTAEWVANPDHARDLALLGGLGCRVYLTPVPVPAPFASLARRADDDAQFPYMLFFVGTSRVVLQTHLPFCPRDEDLDDVGVRGPELSMSLGTGAGHRASLATFLPVVPPEPSRGRPAPPKATANGVEGARRF